MNDVNQSDAARCICMCISIVNNNINFLQLKKILHYHKWSPQSSVSGDVQQEFNPNFTPFGNLRFNPFILDTGKQVLSYIVKIQLKFCTR